MTVTYTKVGPLLWVRTDAEGNPTSDFVVLSPDTPDTLESALAAVAAAQNPSAEPVTAADVRAEAARRLAPTDWMVWRAADPSDGTPVPEGALTYRAGVRAASNAMEDDPPADFMAPHHWPPPLWT